MNKKISLLRIVDLVFILLFILFIAYMAIDLSNITKTLKETQKEKMNLLLNYQKDVYSSLLYFGFDYELKDNLVSLVKKNPNITGVRLYSPRFDFSYPKNPKGQFVKADLVYKNKSIGELFLYYTDRQLINNFFKKYFHRFFIYIVFILPLTLLLWFYIRKKIKSLNKLAKKVEKINFKKTSMLEKIDDYLEIVLISNAINKLLLQVNSFYLSQKNIIKKLVKYKKQLQNAQKVAKMASWEWDCENKKFESLFKKFAGFKSMEEILPLISDDESFVSRLENICKDCGSFEIIKKAGDVYLKIDAQCLNQGNKKIVIGSLLDITDEIKKQERIEFLAYHDTLTGVANRMFLKEELQCLINFSKRHHSKFALLYLDLDNFKMINDSYGHETGDRVLISVTQRLKNTIRASDILARIGGDEFVIVLTDIKSKEDVSVVAKKILEALKEPVIIENKKFNLSFSIGIAIYPVDSNDIETLFKYADIAMYKAKKEGKNRYEFINEKLKEEIKVQYEISNQIKEGIEKGEFELYFQPQIDVLTNTVYGAEGLIRWNHPKKGLIGPNVFIPISETGDLIYLIDEYVIEEAFKTIKKWSNDPLLNHLKLAVNISAKEFKKNTFIPKLKNLLEKYKIDPEKLEIEITESVSMQNVTYTIKTLEEIKKLGFSISVDDFGTGYSSLNYLKMIPFDIIKIDRSFIKDILNDNDDYLITKMIIEVSKILNKQNIAEGVETPDVLKKIKELGCRYVQGYYFSKPLNYQSFYEFVKKYGKS